jgi:lysine/ornithine N-monooxygenase
MFLCILFIINNILNFNYIYISYIMIYDICIIGAGQSGLTTCKTFSEKNYNLIVLEKSIDYNGMFSTIQEKEYFTWSTSRYMSGFSDFPMDKKIPIWFTIQDYINYLKSYKDHFNLDKYIKYNSNVTKCIQNENQEWIVSYNDTYLICKKLIICTGLNQTPKFPDIINNFTGKIIHTEEVYRNMNKNDWINTFTNKRVLLIGGGESAFDIGHIITQYAKNIYYTTKNYIEWYPKGGETDINLERINKLKLNHIFMLNYFESNIQIPSDTQLSYCEYSLPEIVSFLWHKFGRLFIKQFNSNNCSHDHKELCKINKTPDNIFKKYVVKRTEFLLDIYEDKVNIINYPEKIEGTTIFTKKETIENIDIIVCATGFKKYISFIDDKIYKDDFIKKIIPKNTTNIAFIGYARPTMGSIAIIAEMQSWWTQLYFENNLNYTIRKPLFRNYDPLNLSNDHINSLMIGGYYMKDLAKDMKIEPNMLNLFFTDFKLFKKIYTSSCHPMIYRIHGYKSYNNARNILMDTFNNYDNKTNKLKIYTLFFLILHIFFISICFIFGFFLMHVTYSVLKLNNKNIKYSQIFKLFYIYSILLILYFYK